MKGRSSIMKNDANTIDSLLLNKKRKTLIPDNHEPDSFTNKEEVEDDSSNENENNGEEEKEEEEEEERLSNRGISHGYHMVRGKMKHGMEEDDEEVMLSNRSISHGYHMVRGKMKHGMEDYVAAETRKINGHELGLYAIFDGHSGRDVANYLQSHLFDNILNEPGFWKNPKRAIKKAYKETDDDILDGVVGPRGGSTAVTAILIDQKTLIVANVGDSRAVLCRNGEARAVSVDHEPNKEKELVESKGGYVSNRPGSVPLVDGQLAMTRAFGDGRLKEHITCEPDLITERIDQDVEFLIWPVMGCGR